MTIDTIVHKSQMSFLKGRARARTLTGTAAILAAMVVRDVLVAPHRKASVFASRRIGGILFQPQRAQRAQREVMRLRCGRNRMVWRNQARDYGVEENQMGDGATRIVHK